MPNAPDGPRPDTSDMLAVHAVFRSTLGDAPALVDEAAGDKLWLILGLIQEHMTPDQRADMLVHMPPAAVDMWTTMGERSFVQLAAEVRGGSPAGS